MFTNAGGNVVGGVMVYDLTLTNAGNVTLTGLELVDSAATLSTDCAAKLAANLAPGASLTCTATHTIEQIDLDEGNHLNTATADSGQTAAVTDTAEVLFQQYPSVSLLKTITNTGPYKLGSTINYSLVATNTGNITLDNVTITDDKATITGCTPANTSSLAPKATMTCNAEYVVTQLDVDNGSVINYAEVDSVQAVPATASETATIEQHPSLALTKIETSTGPYSVGDVISYEVKLTNDGTVTLTDAYITDPGTTISSCLPAMPATLAPNASMVCQVAHTVTQDDFDATHYMNTVYGNSDQTPLKIVNAADIPFETHPILNIVKEETTLDPYVVGNDLTYKITVSNGGDVTLNVVTLVDDMAILDSCLTTEVVPQPVTLPTRLPVGASFVCTAHHTITQSDIDGFFYTNVAIADSAETAAVSATVRSRFTPNPGILVEKVTTSTGPYLVDVGVVTFSITVTNDGTNSIEDIVLVESHPDATLTCPAGALVGPLAPEESFVCEVEHVVSQNYIDAGTMINEVYASATVLNSTQTVTDQSLAVAIIPQTNLLTFTKTVTSTGPYSFGQDVTFELTFRNDGNTTLTNVNVTDATAVISGCTLPATLAPGASLTCTAAHTINQYDVDEASYLNEAIADSDQTQPDSQVVQVPVIQHPNVEITKTIVTQSNLVDGAVTFDLVITNTGDTTLDNLQLVDATATISGCTIPATLAPAASFTCTATRTITQADLDRGYYLNIATIDSDQTPLVTAQRLVTFTQNPAVTLTKTEQNPDNIVYVLNSSINYQIFVKNTGNVTLSGILFTDLNATHNCTFPASMAPGAEVTCNASHIVTQSDIDRGSVINTATIDTDRTNLESSSVTTPLLQTPGVTVLKSVFNTGPFVLGDRIVFSVAVENTGNVSLGDPVFVDEKAVMDVCDPPLTARLYPGQTGTCYLYHDVTQSDINAGALTNIASLDTDFTQPVYSQVTVPFAQNPKLDITKEEVSTGPYVVGNVIEYRITLQNSGNVTLTGLSLQEDGDTIANCSKPLTDPLDPGSAAAPAVITCSAFHTVTQADINNGSYVNIARANADQINEVQAQKTITFVQNPSLFLDKIITNPKAFIPGDTIEYSITIRNTGNITLDNIILLDPKATLNPKPCPSFKNILDPGEEFTCNLKHTITQYEYDSGSYDNTATAVSDRTPLIGSTAIATFDLTRDMTVAKTVTSQGPYQVGDTLTYEIVITNNAAASLNHVIPNDDYAEIQSCRSTVPATLGYNTSLICDATHVITVEDINAGSFTNQASASALELETSVFSAEVKVPLSANLSLEKTVTSIGPYQIGDSITYELVAETIGDVILTEVSVTDLGAIIDSTSCSLPATLNPGQSITCQAEHLLTAADFKQENYNNTAIADSLETPAITDSVAVNLRNGLLLDKVVTSFGPYGVDDTIYYDIILTNASKVTQENVYLTDDGADILSCDPALPGSIVPGAKVVCKATHVVTSSEFATENYTNTAYSGSDQNTPIQDAVTTSLLTPTLTFAMSVREATYSFAGQLLHFTYRIMNTGVGTAHEVRVTDSLKSAITCPSDVLAQGAEMVCTGVYAVTSRDIDLGQITNTATLSSVENLSVTTSLSLNALIIEEEEELSSALKLDPLKIPQTGFAPGVETKLPPLEDSRAFHETGGVQLLIPRLAQNMEVVGIPFEEHSWDVNWLASRAGYLAGTAFPTTQGNSVIVGHAVNAWGKAGPFADLKSLSWGDQIIVQAFGGEYVYEVRENKVVAPQDFSVLDYRNNTWLTLITCKDFDQATGEYLSRVVVHAVLVEVR